MLVKVLVIGTLLLLARGEEEPEEKGCKVQDDTYIKSGTHFMTGDCSEKCFCNDGVLKCHDQACPEFSECITRDGEHKCQCKEGFLEDGEFCEKDCPSRSVPFKAHCYKYGYDRSTFDEARVKCQSLGGDLAAISNEEENTFVSHLAGDDVRTWIGGKRKYNDVFRSLQTNGDYTYHFIQDQLPWGIHRHEFSVKDAGKNLYVAFSSEPQEKPSMYEIAIGQDDNTMTYIRRCKECKNRVEMKTQDVLNSSADVRYYVTCRDGKVEFGLIGEKPMIRFVDRVIHPLKCGYIGFATGDGVVGNVKYYRDFSWVTGEDWHYERWRRLRPNVYDQEQSCVEINFLGIGEWNDDSCRYLKRYICEF